MLKKILCLELDVVGRHSGKGLPILSSKVISLRTVKM